MHVSGELVGEPPGFIIRDDWPICWDGNDADPLNDLERAALFSELESEVAKGGNRIFYWSRYEPRWP